MGDLFISYARPDEGAAERVSAALREAGFAVWRDNQLPASRTYAEVIEERLTDAGAVLVLWSKNAVKSQWVRAEADFARNVGTLVQASLDGTPPPIPFNQIRFADLSRWNGKSGDAGWKVVLDSLGALAPQSPPRSLNKPAEEGVSICVLPFENMSGDLEQEYFSDGISEDITTDLGKVSALAVISRNTAFQFKGKAIDVGDVARQLGVSHVLEGSVRKSGNRVRITAQLVDGATGGQIWAERYDRDLTDIFAIQDELSEAIVAALKIKLLPEEKKAIEDRGTANVEAYNLYLMARQIWVTGNHGDRRREERVIRICERAIGIDSRYARAWALMAIAQASLHHGIGDTSAADGVEAARRALAIDPNIAEARCPIARGLLEQGRLDEAEAEIAAALKLDPDSWEVNKEAARFFFRERRIDEATHHYLKAARAMETDYHAWGLLYSCYQARGDEDGMLHAAQMVVRQVERALEEDPYNGAALSLGASGLAVIGQPERGREWIDRALLVDPDNINMRYNFACTLAATFKDNDGAIEMLRPALAKAAPGTVRLAQTDPDLDSLRSDERFQEMMAAAEKRLSMKRSDEV